MTGSAVPVLDVWTQKNLFKERGVGRGMPIKLSIKLSIESCKRVFTRKSVYLYVYGI